MTTRSLPIALTILLGLMLPVTGAEKVEPVRMGSGLMTFDTVPGWGLAANGKSVLGPTHGGVVIDMSAMNAVHVDPTNMFRLNPNIQPG